MPLRSQFLRAAALLAAVLLHGCATKVPAPVIDRAPPPVVEVAPTPPAPVSVAPTPPPKPPEKGPVHTVGKGDTLIGIALAYGLDYRELAVWNNITNPNRIDIGQELRLTAPGTVTSEKPGTVTAGLPGAGAVEAKPLTPGSSPTPAASTAREKTEPKGLKLPYSERALAQLSAPEPGTPLPAPTPVPVPPETAPATPTASAPTAPATPTTPAKPGDADAVDWAWPAKGKIISGFTELNKGIDISGKKGEPVLAAASGRVVYSGTGVRGYGKLIIVKHNDTYLSAYAHNDTVLIKEGQEVKKGQKIAEMGSTDSDKVKLHFEVRKLGKPVDPAGYLPK